MVEALNYRELYLAAREVLESDFETGQLFAHVTGWMRHDLPLVGQEPAPRKQVQQLMELAARRQRGEPLQYLLGEWEFYGLPFTVGEGVLIPRADTEVLVDVALEAARQFASPRILDLCSGSGAVAVALAHLLPEAHVTAVELSETAFGYLEQNIARNNVSVEAVREDLYRYQPGKRFHVITANPPYIPSCDLAELQTEVQQEPSLALDGGTDGLDFYRGIAARYRGFLEPGGCLALEVGMGQHDAVAEIALAQGFSNVTVHKDLAGIDRVLTLFYSKLS